MVPGEVVTLNNSDEKWVLCWRIRKRISGVVKEKIFFKLFNSPLFIPEIKPYTKERAKNSQVVKIESLSARERDNYASIAKNKWKIYEN